MEQAKRSLHLITRSFAIAGIAMVVVLSIVDFADPAEPDLASGAVLAAASFGVGGLLVALHWWSRSGETPRPPTNLMLSFVVRVAVAELGLLIGIIGLIMTGSTTAPFVGLGLFLASLLFLDLGLRRIS